MASERKKGNDRCTGQIQKNRVRELELGWANNNSRLFKKLMAALKVAEDAPW
jgi:hypothetical protein